MKLQQQGSISNDNIKRFWEAFSDSSGDMKSVLSNTVFLTAIFKQYGFKEVINKLKKCGILKDFLSQRAIFRPKYTDQIPLSNLDFLYLVKSITAQNELEKFLHNKELLNRCFSNFVLTFEDLTRFESLVKGIVMNQDMQTLSGYIKIIHKDDPTLLDSFQLVQAYYQSCLNFTDDQKVEIHNILKNNEFARNTLKQLVESHLEDQYDFESLKNLLTKDNDKKLKTKFNF